MIQIRKAEDRGHTDWGWLDSYHTFSFGGYIDPENKQFRSLRVINDDKIAPAKGFGEHPHRDMEILSYVVSGSLEHKDSMGNGSVIKAGEVQRMTAGTGITHSEFNPSDTETTHLIQIWLFPEEKGLEPEYEQKKFDVLENPGQLILLASNGGRNGSVHMNQDASLYAAAVQEKDSISYLIEKGRYAWVHVVYGELLIHNQKVKTGDGIKFENESSVVLTANQDSLVLIFDLS